MNNKARATTSSCDTSTIKLRPSGSHHKDWLIWVHLVDEYFSKIFDSENFQNKFLKLYTNNKFYHIAKAAKKVVKKAAPKKVVAPKKKVAKKVTKKVTKKAAPKKTAKKAAKKGAKKAKKWTEWNLFIILIVSIVNLKKQRKTKSNFLIKFNLLYKF